MNVQGLYYCLDTLNIIKNSRKRIRTTKMITIFECRTKEKPRPYIFFKMGFKT